MSIGVNYTFIPQSKTRARNHHHHLSFLWSSVYSFGSLFSTSIDSVYLFGVDRQGNQMKQFELRSTDQSIFNEQRSFHSHSYSSMTFILTTSIEVDRDIDLELLLFRTDLSQLFRVGSIHLSIDDLMNPQQQRVLKIDEFNTEHSLYNDFIHRSNNRDLFFRLENVSIYFNTFFRLDISIQSKSKFDLIGHCRRLFSNIGLKKLTMIADGYLRVDEGNIFEHVLIHLVNSEEFLSDDLIIHFYAE